MSAANRRCWLTGAIIVLMAHHDQRSAARWWCTASTTTASSHTDSFVSNYGGHNAATLVESGAYANHGAAHQTFYHSNDFVADAPVANVAAAAETAALFTAEASAAVRHRIHKTPQEIMVDVTNRLAFSVLNAHTNKHDAKATPTGSSNFVFSPCGLMSVLIALYEGTSDQSAYEIYRTMRLPWDRDVVRIGVRDIHRRLRIYFYPEQNLLDGLSLSKESVTIRREYEEILLFYGYNLNDHTMVIKEKPTPAAPAPTLLTMDPTLDTRIMGDSGVDTKTTTEMNFQTTTERIPRTFTAIPPNTEPKPPGMVTPIIESTATTTVQPSIKENDNDGISMAMMITDKIEFNTEQATDTVSDKIAYPSTTMKFDEMMM